MSVNQNTQLVALDIDGTLLAPGVDFNALPDQAIVQAVSELQAHGIIVMLATGRMFPGAKKIAEHLGLTTPVICQQGASVHEPDGSLLYSHTIDADLAQELYAYATEHHFSLAWFDHERYLVTSNTRESWFFAGVSGVEFEITSEPHKDIVHPTGVDIVSNQQASTGVHKLLEARYGNRIALLDFSSVTAVHAPGASKGNALKQVASELGIDQSAVLAIGDGINDVSMLSWAGQSAAPSHGDAFALDSAKEILDGDGVSGVAARLRAVIS